MEIGTVHRELFSKSLVYLKALLYDHECDFDNWESPYYDDGSLYEDIITLRGLIQDIEKYLND